MSRLLHRTLPVLAAVVSILFSCGKEKMDPTPEPTPAPKAITLSSSSFQVAQAGEKLSLTITAPSRPSFTGLPSWITYVDGTFNAYSMTVGLTVAANETYEERSATVTVASTGRPRRRCPGAPSPGRRQRPGGPPAGGSGSFAPGSAPGSGGETR